MGLRPKPHKPTEVSVSRRAAERSSAVVYNLYWRMTPKQEVGPARGTAASQSFQFAGDPPRGAGKRRGKRVTREKSEERNGSSRPHPNRATRRRFFLPARRLAVYVA